MSSNVRRFIENPTLDLFEKCRKDDLLVIAEHFKITVSRQSLKRTIKTVVLDGLSKLNVLKLPESVKEADQVSEKMTTCEGVEADDEEIKLVEADVEAKTGLPPFEPFSPPTPGSRESANLKIRIARLRMEAEDRAQARRAEFDLRLEIRRLEVQAEKEVNLRRLELEEGKLSSRSTGPFTSDSLAKIQQSVVCLPRLLMQVKTFLWCRYLGSWKWTVILVHLRELLYH